MFSFFFNLSVLKSFTPFSLSFNKFIFNSTHALKTKLYCYETIFSAPLSGDRSFSSKFPQDGKENKIKNTFCLNLFPKAFPLGKSPGNEVASVLVNDIRYWHWHNSANLKLMINWSAHNSSLSLKIAVEITHSGIFVLIPGLVNCRTEVYQHHLKQLFKKII